MNYKKIITALVITLISSQSFAESLYDRKIKDVRIYDMFVKQGIPEAAVQRTFEFLDVNAGKTIKVRSKFRGRDKTYMGEREVTIRNEFIAIIDFSKPSSERRLYVMNLKDGAVSKHFVAHGKGSGVRVAG